MGSPLVFLAIGFFLSPFIIRTLGNARYGAWSFVAELLGYSSLMDFGLRSAVNYYVGHYSTRGESDRLRAAICSAFWTLLGVGILLALAGAIVAFRFSPLFVKGQTDTSEVAIAMSLLASAIGLGLPAEVFASVLIGYRRLDLLNAIDLSSRVLAAAGIFAVLEAGGGLIPMAAVQCASRLATGLMNYTQARRLAGGLPLNPAWFRREELKRLAGLGSMNVLFSISSLVIFRTDLIVTGMFLGVKWVAYYSIGRMLVDQCSELGGNLARAFTPHFTYLAAKNDHGDIRRLYLVGARLSGTMALALAASLAAFGHSFLSLWVGKAYVSGDFTRRSDVVLLVLLIAQVPRWLQNISWQLLLATKRYGFATPLGIAEAVANLGLSLLFVKRYALLGVALGTLIPMAASNILAAAYVLTAFRIGLLEYLRRGIGRPLAAGVGILFFNLLLIRWSPPTNWRMFFIEAAVALAFEIAVCAVVCVTNRERRFALSWLRGTIGGLARAGSISSAG